VPPNAINNLINAAYLVAAVLFILGLQGLTSPRTARRGNLMGAGGMLLAVVATLLDRHIVTFEWIVAGVIAGAAIGAVSALRVPMTAMPQMVAVFNGFGGGASALVAATAVLAPETLPDIPAFQLYSASAASAIVGGATLTGSLVAFAKLQDLVKSQARGGLVRSGKLVSAAAAIAAAAYFVYDPSSLGAFWVLAAAACFYGLLFTVPVGGADMPVVIALLNSASGLAAAATGFVLSNNVLIISGSLVGASGFILTQIMCKAMNRSLGDVLAGDLGEAAAETPGEEIYQGRVKSATPEEAALIFEGARLVIVVPGYGMAVAQAQHAVSDLMHVLEDRGTEVRFAIHPVAGRMPGHMNVLLAEADIPYDKLCDMDAINPVFKEADVSIVLGANDVVNPAARDEPGSAIYGMPILNVDQSRTVMVIKRSLSPGFAGIPNRLFAAPNTQMIFGDAKQVVRELITALKEQ